MNTTHKSELKNISKMPSDEEFLGSKRFGFKLPESTSFMTFEEMKSLQQNHKVPRWLWQPMGQSYRVFFKGQECFIGSFDEVVAFKYGTTFGSTYCATRQVMLS